MFLKFEFIFQTFSSIITINILGERGTFIDFLNRKEAHLPPINKAFKPQCRALKGFCHPWYFINAVPGTLPKHKLLLVRDSPPMDTYCGNKARTMNQRAELDQM